VDTQVETEEEFITKVEVRIKIPDDTKAWLVDDWDLITRQKKLFDLPAKYSVDQFLEDYLKQKKGTKGVSNKDASSPIGEVITGIKEYFNVMIGCQLLYKFERPQYEKLLKGNAENEKPMSSIYGVIHLLRLFTKLGQMMVYTDLEDKDMVSLVAHMQDILKYLAKTSLFSTQDYQTASPEYHRKAL
jgi:hypothetical protein